VDDHRIVIRSRIGFDWAKDDFEGVTILQSPLGAGVGSTDDIASMSTTFRFFARTSRLAASITSTAFFSSPQT